MFIKTVSTTSGINPIKFDETGGVFYWILNTGLSTIYASTKSAFTAGDDGVVSLGPKESRRLETNNDTIYILGRGQVEIHNQRDGICSFKQAPTSSGSGGGGTVDAYSKTESDAKYAQKTDVVPYKMGMDFATCTTPAETVVKSVTTMHKVAPALGAVFAVKFNNAVPAQARLNINGLMGYIQYRGGSIPNGVINAGDIATFIYYSSRGLNTFEILSVENGGNADTVDGMHANDFITGEAIQRRTTIDDCITAGTYTVSTVYTTDIPTQYGTWGICDVRVYGLGVYQIIQYTGNANVICRSKIVGQTDWTEWKEISATPIKSTGLITSPTDGYGTIILPNSDTRRYLSIAAVGCYAEMFLVNDKYTVHIVNENYEKIINTPVTYTAFYIE